MTPPAPARLAAIAIALLLASAARADEVIRVAVAAEQTQVLLSGKDLLARPLQGEEARELGERVEVTLADGRLSVNGAPFAAAGLRISALGPIRCGGRSLRGEVEVRRTGDSLAVIDALPIEAYVAGVVTAEMPPGFPLEALKAQAVAARTFALSRKLDPASEARGYDVGATVRDQVFPDADPAERAREAALATTGEVLSYGHELALAYFHAACGGRTERGADALGKDLPYLRSVECGRCRNAPHLRWTLRLSREALARAAGLSGRATGARVVTRTRSGRAARVEVESGGRRVRLSATELRRRLGYERLPSLAFELRAGPDGFELDGRGSGHGAGLCQWGAAGFAREGKGYAEILAHYYPGAEILRMY